MSFILKHIPKIVSGFQKNGIFYKNFRTGTVKRQLDENINKYLKLAFIQADKDKDGKVSVEEINQTIKMFFIAKGKPENPLVNAFFEKMIFQDKTTLSQDEFMNRVNYSVNFLVGFAEELLKVKFSHRDLDKDGKLNKEETEKLLEELYPFSGKEQLEHFMGKYDKDKDGIISLPELMEFAKEELFAVKL